MLKFKIEEQKCYELYFDNEEENAFWSSAQNNENIEVEPDLDIKSFSPISNESKIQPIEYEIRQYFESKSSLESKLQIKNKVDTDLLGSKIDQNDSMQMEKDDNTVLIDDTNFDKYPIKITQTRRKKKKISKLIQLNDSSKSISQQDKFLKDIENLVQKQTNELYKKIDSFRKAKDQELLKLVSDKIEAIPNQFDKIIRNQIKIVLYPQLNNSLLPILDNKINNLFQEVFIPKFDSFFTNVKKSDDIKITLGDTFKSYFTDTLAPGFSKLCQNLFYQLNKNWNIGLEEYKNSKIENMTNETVANLFLSTTENLNEKFLNSQKKPSETTF